MLCPDMILVSNLTGLYLYETPQAHLEDQVCTAIPSTILRPLASFNYHHPYIGKQLWDSLCPRHHGGRVATYTFTENEDALLILPGPGQSTLDFVRYVVDGPCSMGNSRAIGCPDFIHMQPMKLTSFTHFTKHDDHPGYMRMGRINAPHPNKTTVVPLEGFNGRTEDLSWDESSGTICIICSPFHDRSTRTLLMVDMI